MMETLNGAELCFPQLLNSSCRKPSPPWPEALLLNIILSFISLIIVALNLLVIISVSHYRQLQKPTNILLLSLAISDILIGFLILPVEIFRRTKCWSLGDITCSLYYFVACVSLVTSVGNIVLISADRYVAVCYPLHYPTRITLARMKSCVCFCWCWSAVYSTYYSKDELIKPGISNSCTGECTVSVNHIAGTVDLFVSFIFPVTAIIVLYMRVFKVAVAQARTMRSHRTAVTRQPSVNLQTKKSELKAARTLGVLVTVHLMCFCPYYCCSLIVDGLSSSTYASVFFFLFCFNSCLNPLIYALFYPWFRKAVKHIVTLQILKPGSCEANIL